MTELEQEAENHWKMAYIMGLDESTKSYIINDFIAGANSKYVEKQKLKFAIEQLYKFRESTFGKGVNVIKELEQKLSKL